MKLLVFLCALFAGSMAATTVEILAGDPAGRFSILLNLVTQAGLVDTLNDGTYTIFAPTNDAFQKVPVDALTALQNSVTALTSVLTYHVVSNVIKSTAAKDELKVATVNGESARFNVYTHNNVVTIQGAKISQFDLTASNGVVHVLDSVMMPPMGDIVSYVSGNANLSTVLDLVLKAGLASALQQDGLTLFAPTNAAFGLLPPDQLTAVQNDAMLLAKVLKYHVVTSTEYSAGLYKREHFHTLDAGQRLLVHLPIHGHSVKINNATVTMTDIGTTNGVVHVIDHVLIPQTGTPAVGR